MKIKWNLPAFEEIRRSSEVNNLLEGVVDRITSQLPEGYEGAVTRGRTRSRGSVVTAEYEAIVDNATHNSLIRALGGAHVD